MRLHRFFIDEIIGAKTNLNITDEAVLHQWKRVFRLEAGESVVLFDGSGKEYECKIDLLSKERAELKVGEVRTIPEIAKEVWLCASVIKKDNFEWVVQKATELGVSHIVPVMSERSEKKDLNKERLQKIAIEASEQSGRGTLPHIYDVVSLDEACALVGGVQAYVFDKSGNVLSVDERMGKNPIALFVGPEGGWSDADLAFLKEKNVAPRTLGQQILRAETASVAISALFLL